jgi:uncharacterized protein
MHYLFLGAGPANLFSILYLIENGFDGSLITVIDRGENPYNRAREDLLYGFGGAGFWSDGKYIFADYYNVVKEEERTKYYKFLKDKLTGFVLPNAIQVSKPKNFELKETDLKLKQAECWHFGSTNNVVLGKQLYDYFLKKGVHFDWKKEVLDINLDRKSVRTNKFVYYYSYLQIGLGQKSSSFIKALCNNNNILIKSGAVHIGGRFECEFNDKIKELSQIQYDFKLVKKYKEGIEIRTFCVNSGSAYVVEEKFNGRIQYNGHSYGGTDKYNNLVNFGILAELKSKDSYLLQNLLIKQLNGNYLYLKQKPLFKSSLDINNIPILTQLPFLSEELNFYFYDFISEINGLFNLKNNYIFYLPEIKLNPGIIDVDENFNLKDGKYNEVNWVGDGCVGTRGIIPASLTGMKAVEKFLK